MNTQMAPVRDRVIANSCATHVTFGSRPARAGHQDQLRPAHERPAQERPSQSSPAHERPAQERPAQERPAQSIARPRATRPGAALPRGTAPRVGAPARRTSSPAVPLAADPGATRHCWRWPTWLALHGPRMSCSPLSSTPPSATCEVPRAASSEPVPGRCGKGLGGRGRGGVRRGDEVDLTGATACGVCRGHRRGGAAQDRLDLVRRQVRTVLEQQRHRAGDDRGGLRGAAALEEAVADRAPGCARSR